MLYYINLINTLEILVLILPSLLAVAFVTIAERKTMASMQRRLGPNFVGYYGLLQPFADALKLLIKEYIVPSNSNTLIFFLGSIVTLLFSLFGYAMIPYGPGISLFDYYLGILYMLAVSSLATYGILLAGWSANSAYAFLGSLRSTAQLISYELIITSALLLVVLLAGSFNLTVIVEMQSPIWFVFPLISLFFIFYIAAVAETNRAPFDLAEAESELVSGFMTEHAAGIFVFFFLAEYASIILICILMGLVLLGGYLIIHIFNVYYILNHIDLIFSFIYGLSMSTKSYFLVFVFILVRASFPRIRFDQLMSYCWTVLLPIVISLIVFTPCIISSFYVIPCNILL